MYICMYVFMYVLSVVFPLQIEDMRPVVVTPQPVQHVQVSLPPANPPRLPLSIQSQINTARALKAASGLALAAPAGAADGEKLEDGAAPAVPSESSTRTDGAPPPSSAITTTAPTSSADDNVAPEPVFADTSDITPTPVSTSFLSPSSLLPAIARPVPVPDDEMVASSLPSSAMRGSRHVQARPTAQPQMGYARSVPRVNPPPGMSAVGPSLPMTASSTSEAIAGGGGAGVGVGDAAAGGSSPRSLQSPAVAGSRLAFTPMVVNYMKTWLRERMSRNPGQGIPYVNDEEKTEIAHNTGLTTRQISQWFQNRRKDYANCMKNNSNFLNHLNVADPNDRPLRQRIED